MSAREEGTKKGTELVIKIAGGIQKSTFDVYEKEQLAWLNKANLNPATDEDFLAAVKFIKDCLLTEATIAKILDEALRGNLDVSRLLDRVTALKDKAREMRLAVAKPLDNRKLFIKQEAIKSGKQRVIEFVKGMYVAYPGIEGCLNPDLETITAAAKRKSTNKTLSAAVNAAVERIEKEVGDLADECSENLKLVEASELQALFPDKKDLIKKTTGEVVALIEGREAKHRLEVERRENAAKIRNPEALAKLKVEVDEKGHFCHLENWAKKHASAISEGLPNAEDLAEFREHYSGKLRQLKGDPPAATEERRQAEPAPASEPATNQEQQAEGTGKYTIHLSVDLDGTKAQAGELRDAFHALVGERSFIVGDIEARLTVRDGN